MKKVKLPPPLKGYTRKYCQCKECKRVYYKDYVPYSLSNPVIFTLCGHSLGYEDYNLRDITEAVFHRLRTKELEKAFKEKTFE